MEKYCPVCNQRYVTAEHIGDYVHTCNSGKEVLDNEDVVITTSSVTELGSTFSTFKKPSEIRFQGISNKFFGMRPAVEGERFCGVTSRGNNKQTHRTRQHEEYIEF